jgi:acetyl-CoA carboxylase biotin carboxyl carrier protein
MRAQQGVNSSMTDTIGDAEDGMQIDPDLVRQLAQLLNENDLTEIEVEHGDRRIAVKRQIFAAAAPGPAAPAYAVGAAAPTAAPAQAADEASAASHPGTVKSPMVGTAYLAAEPGAQPFVSTGSRVEAGDTLVIVEAMKVMNPITAPRGGVVKQILVQDSQPVEYDQPLLIIE